MTITTDLKHISYDRITKDFRAEYDGELIGFYSNHLAAEQALNAYALDLIVDGLAFSATELDQELT